MLIACVSLFFFFFVFSFFRFFVAASQLDLLEYILENKERLLPIFGGSEAVLGGPNIVDINGRDPVLLALLSHSNASTLAFLINLPSFDSNFITADGLSVFDTFLKHITSDLAAILAYVNLNPPITEHTADLLLSRAEEMEYEHFESLAPLLARLEPPRRKQLVRYSHN